MRNQKRVRVLRDHVKSVVPQTLTVEDKGTCGFVVKRGDDVIAITRDDEDNGIYLAIEACSGEVGDPLLMVICCKKVRCTFMVRF